ncbi:MAG TPA: glycoside hydrolase family 3 C-terminal domain-containing protein [Terriglobales bacterium]|nr:glycoside hydrolase family 3 C-terminal domain-containing protein [Terriglobales bacterium]
MTRTGRLRTALTAALLLLLLLPGVCQTASPQADVEARVDALLKQLSIGEKIDLIGGVDDFYIREIRHIGLPRLKMSDGPVGVRNYGPSTAVGGIALAAAWDPELAQRVGVVFGQDARARGVHFLLGPGVNIYRAPRNGRNFEYFGEDPFLAARTAVGYIKGLQSQGVSATVKHFMGNNSEFDRHNVDSIIDERTMREIYLPVFEAAVKEAHVGAIMDSYNLTNGVHLTENGYLNSDVAKKDWGFTGILMSDWDATYDGVAAANGGLDLEMPSGKFMNRTTLLPAISSGKVSEATIDDKVRRILRTAVEFGWMGREQTDSSIPLLNDNGRQVALEVARSGMVLLKNDGNLLPLDKSRIKSIAVIGPDAYPARPVGGGSAEVKPFVAASFLEGIAQYLGTGAKVYYEQGVPTLEELADQTHFTTEANGGQPGLRAEFFDNSSLAGKPGIERIDKKASYDPGATAGMSANDGSIRWTGYYTPASAGDYMFFVQGPGENGGYRLYVDKKLVIDDWTQAYAFLSQVKLPLTYGAHQVELNYFVRRGWGKSKLNFGIARTEDLVSAQAKDIAAHADAVVVAAGFDPSIEGESADRMFVLPPGQDQLINQIAAVNKNTVVVMTSGGGVDMTAWVDHVPALFQAWFPGEEGGTALAQLLFGDYNPSGKLPVTFERRWEDNPAHDTYYPKNGDRKVAYTEGVFIGYRGFEKSGVKALFPFGYGLSYTTFAYKNLAVTPSSASGQPVELRFEVTNSGTRAGAEVAEVFVGDHHSRIPRPIKELKGFAKVTLQPGETRQVNVRLDRRAFAYYDVSRHDWAVDPGDFDLFVGPSSAQIELTGKVVVGAQ